MHDALGPARAYHGLSEVVQGVATERLASSVLLLGEWLTRLALVVGVLSLRRCSLLLLNRSPLVLGLFDLMLGRSGYRLLFPLVESWTLLALAHVLDLAVHHVHVRTEGLVALARQMRVEVTELCFMIWVLGLWLLLLLHLSIVVH